MDASCPLGQRSSIERARNVVPIGSPPKTAEVTRPASSRSMRTRVQTIGVSFRIGRAAYAVDVGSTRGASIRLRGLFPPVPTQRGTSVDERGTPFLDRTVRRSCGLAIESTYSYFDGTPPSRRFWPADIRDRVDPRSRDWWAGIGAIGVARTRRLPPSADEFLPIRRTRPRHARPQGLGRWPRARERNPDQPASPHRTRSRRIHGRVSVGCGLLRSHVPRTP